MSTYLTDVVLPDYFYDIEHVRALLENVTENNLEGTEQRISNSTLFAKEKKAVADLIKKYSEIRDKNQQLYAKIASQLAAKSQKFGKFILDISEGRFLRFLYTEGAVDFNDVYKKIKNDPLNKAFFAPELNLTSEKENWKAISEKSTVAELSANNWRLFNDIIQNLSEENTIERALRTDDSDFIVNLSTSVSFKVSSQLLEQAAFYGAVRCFKLLLLYGAKITRECVNAAIKGGSLEIVRICDQMKAPFTSALKAAVEYQRDDIFDWLLNKRNIEPLKFNDFTSAFFYKGVKYAIDKSYCISNIANNKKSPLHEAVEKDDILMAQLLIEGGIDPNVRDLNGKAPIHAARNARMIIKLINCGADPNARDKSGASPIFSALQRDDIKIIKTLVENGADVNATNVIHKTAMYYAREWKKFRAIETLIELGCTKSEAYSSNVMYNASETNYSLGRIILE